jgi:major type 1 subunit fimbrin (pilin)
MSKRLLSAALIAGLGLAFVPGAHAVDGVISFQGQIASNTCTINNGSTQSFTVTLPTVGASALGNSSGTVAGTTPFTIDLSACTATGNVQAYFEPGSTINTNGRLDTGVTGVDLRLLNDGQNPIDLNTQSGTTVAAISSGAATLKYFVQYYNNGAGSVGTGAVNSTVAYSIVYP